MSIALIEDEETLAAIKYAASKVARTAMGVVKFGKMKRSRKIPEIKMEPDEAEEQETEERISVGRRLRFYFDCFHSGNRRCRCKKLINFSLSPLGYRISLPDTAITLIDPLS